MKLGFVYFVDIGNSQKGVAVVHGETPFDIVNVGELDTGTHWLTNHPDGIPGGSAGAHALFFSDKYLRVKADKILNQLCVPEDTPASRKAEILGQIFHNVISYGRKIFGVENLPRYEYRKGLRRILKEDDEIELPELVSKMVTDSTQYYTFSTEKVNKDRLLSFTLPAVDHSRNILKTPLPDGQWRCIENIPHFPEEIKEWFGQRKTPYFAKVVLSNFDEQYFSLINFGSVTPEGSERQWVTGIELEKLYDKVDVTILEAWESSSVLVLPENIMSDIEALPEIGDLCYSLGLFMENVWTGLALNSVPNFCRNKKSGRYQNAAGPFLRAADWGYCFDKAVALKDMGFSIAGYGVGRVVVDASFQTNEEIVLAALQNELIPPVCKDICIESEASDTYLAKLQRLYLVGDTDQLVAIDSMCTKKYMQA